MLTFKQFKRLIESNKNSQQIPTALVIHDYSRKIPNYYGSFVESDSSDIDEKEKILQDKVDYNDRDLINSLNNYTGNEGSRQLNLHLLVAHHTNQVPRQIVRLKPEIFKPKEGEPTVNISALDRGTRTPIGMKLDAYSGVAFDPRCNTNENGLIHFPAYTSTTLERPKAITYGEDPLGLGHIIHFHLNGNDTGIYANHRENPAINQRELILPRNTTARIFRSHMDPDIPGLMVHHAEIVHGVNTNDVERNPGRLYSFHDADDNGDWLNATRNYNNSNEHYHSNLHKLADLIKDGKIGYFQLSLIKRNVPDREYYDTHLAHLVEEAKRKIRERDEPMGINYQY